MFLVGVLATAPDGSGANIGAIAAMHCGSVAAGEAAMRPLKAFGPPIMDLLVPTPYTAINMMLDSSLPPGARNYWKSHFLPALPDPAIDALVDAFERAPSPMCQIAIEHFHGAVTRVSFADTAMALRDAGFNVLVLAQWMDEAMDEKAMDWCRSAYAALKPFVGPRRYLNYLDADDSVDDTLVPVYGRNLARLRKIKTKYDPENVFRLNLNIPPGA
jgi:hypothetical protein